MVTVELEFEEQELVDILMQEFTKRYLFDDITIELVRRYFEQIINDGNCTLFYGPSKIEDYVIGTWDTLSVIGPQDPDYSSIKKAWEEKTYSFNNGEVVAEYNNNYLVQWY